MNEATQQQPSNVITLPGPIDPKRTPKLAEALAKAQLEIQNAEKNAEAELSFKDGAARRILRYADLAAVLNAVREPLARNGLAFMQLPTTDTNGVTVVGRLLHVSGEYVENSLWLPVALKTPQGYGSTLTYCRRYQASAMLGVAQEDDDGMAGGAAAPGGKAPPSPKAKPAKPDSSPTGPIPEEWREPLDQLAQQVRECESVKQVDDLAMKNMDFAKGLASVRTPLAAIFRARREELAKKENGK